VRFNHLHAAVRDLPGAVEWLAKVWDVRPSFESSGMAVVTLHGVSVVLDAADDDVPTTIGFASEDCDADYRLATGRGAETVEEPRDRPWGVRAAYLRGPGKITFEIEQRLPGSA